MCKTKITAMMALTLSSAQALEAPRFDIVAILGQFVVAETATKVCHVSDQAIDLGFARNRQIVVSVAAEALQARNPNMSHEELVARESQIVENLVVHTTQYVKQSRCSSSEVQRLIDLYRLQAKMDFSAVR